MGCVFSVPNCSAAGQMLSSLQQPAKHTAEAELALAGRRFVPR